MSDSEQSTPQITKVGSGRITTADSGSLPIAKFSPDEDRRQLGASGHSKNGLYSERTLDFLNFTGTAASLNASRTVGSPPSPPPYEVTVTCPSCWAELYTQRLPLGSTRGEMTACSQAGPNETCSGVLYQDERTERQRRYEEGLEPYYCGVTQDERLELHRKDLSGDPADGTDPASLASTRLAVEKVVAQQED